MSVQYLERYFPIMESWLQTQILCTWCKMHLVALEECELMSEDKSYS